MNYLKPSLIRGIPLIALLVASTLSATIVKTATVLPPCQEQSAEYNWQPEVVYARASPADCHLRRVLGQEGFRLPAGAAAAANKPAKKHTHMVYVPAETGSHLSGRWVEVDDNSDNSAALAGANDVKKTGNATLRAVQSNSGAVLNPAGGN